MALSKPDIDKTFERAVYDMGGELVASTLKTKSPSHDNADFLFREWNVVCELKVLENDPNENRALDRKAQGFFDKWMEEGRLFGFGEVPIASERLPHDMQWQLAKLHSEAIRRVLRKANRQIKQTSAALQMPSAKGHVVIVNNSIPTLNPYSFAFAVHQSLGHYYSSINGVSSITVNYVTTLPGMPTTFRLWLDYVRDEITPLNPAYLDNFRKKWVQCISAALGEPVPFLEAPHNFDLRQFGDLKST